MSLGVMNFWSSDEGDSFSVGGFVSKMIILLMKLEKRLVICSRARAVEVCSDSERSEDGDKAGEYLSRSSSRNLFHTKGTCPHGQCPKDFFFHLF